MGRRYDDDDIDLSLTYIKRSDSRKRYDYHDDFDEEDDEYDYEYEYEEDDEEEYYSGGYSSKRGNLYENYSNNKNNKKNQKKKRKKKHRVFRTVFGFIFVNAILLFLVIKFVPGSKEFILTNCGGTVLKCFVSEEEYNNIFDSQFNKDGLRVNEGINSEKFHGYYTIALFGIDSRVGKMDAGVNADSIILASINQDTGEVVLSSVYRDTWVNIADEDGLSGYKKINSAYCSGGAVSAINTMNANFDLNITDYITVNWQGLATIIDMLGGLDMTITEAEMQYINASIAENEAVTGMDSYKINSFGDVHLDGLQAVAYCRIRAVSYYEEDETKLTNDMGRTARQRYVLSLMIEKAKSAGVSRVLDIAEAVFSDEENIIRTSISYDDMMDMIPTFITYDLEEMRGFPFTYDFPSKSLTNGESALVAGGLSYNVRKLHEFFYDDSNYVPSETVMDIDEELKENTGIEDMAMQQ